MNAFNNIVAAMGLSSTQQPDANQNIGYSNISGQGQLMSSAAGLGSAQAYRDKTPAEQIADYRAHVNSRDKVLEYFEAQLNMDLFKGDPTATGIFNAAMSAAFEQVKKL